MVERTAPSRLHFGLLSLPGDDDAARAFGGAGLMIREPGLRLSVEEAKTWSATGPLASRALEFGQTFVAATPEIEPSRCFSIAIHEAPPEHVGLGTGTQLAMAVADGITSVCGVRLSAIELAQRVGRGRRSGIGVHGYREGGFLVDGGKGPKTAVAPCLVRARFPDDWKIVLAIPQGIRGEHGAGELEAFAHLGNDDSRLKHTEAMSRLLLLGVLPGLIERDVKAFAESLHEYNRRAGEMFRPVQGGVYSNAITADVIDRLRKMDLAGVGQSSWGPTVFAIAETERIQSAVAALSAVYGDAVRVLATNAYQIP